MRILTDSEILEFVKNNIGLAYDESFSRIVIGDIYCHVYGSVRGNVDGNVYGDVGGDVKGDIRSGA